MIHDKHSSPNVEAESQIFVSGLEPESRVADGTQIPASGHSAGQEVSKALDAVIGADAVVSLFLVATSFFQTRNRKRVLRATTTEGRKIQDLKRNEHREDMVSKAKSKSAKKRRVGPLMTFVGQITRHRLKRVRVDRKISGSRPTESA